MSASDYSVSNKNDDNQYFTDTKLFHTVTKRIFIENYNIYFRNYLLKN